MSALLNVNLPDSLKPYASRIEATVKPFIQIRTGKGRKPGLLQNKFGGNPYWHKDKPFPTDSKNQPMVLLAQINFSEIPKLPDFPSTGILQIYISGSDEIYGIDFNNPSEQKDFRVVFFPEVIEDKGKLIDRFDFLPDASRSPLQGGERNLEFVLRQAPIPTCDYQFEEKIFGKEFPLAEKDRYDFYEIYEELFGSEGHKIGGYPYFTQNDPRGYGGYDDQILLFQMDTDEEADIIWGDSGVGNFFIKETELRARDFSRVLYNWDCL